MLLRNATLGLLALAAVAHGREDTRVYTDAAGDALIRRTDPGADGPLNPGQALPDLESLSLSRWSTPTPATDPFTGAIGGSSSGLFRLDAIFSGLVNPPGPIGDAVTADPFVHGPNPLYGFIELNIDRDRQTGGEPTGEAIHRFLANVARFGGRPSSSEGDRAVTLPEQLVNHTWLDSPQFELSGTEFVLALCGCEPLTVVSTSVPADTTFGPGDTWNVRGRVFRRTSGYKLISPMNTTGGDCSQPGEYAPMVTLRFSHDILVNKTTVSLVYALDQTGAGLLAGLPSAPPVNRQVECDGNAGSILEALTDLADAARAIGGSWPSQFARTLAQRWSSQEPGDIEDMLDPTDWRVNALFGTTYSDTIGSPSADGALFVWTDAGFECSRGDLNGDALVNTADYDAITARITQTDGSALDADGLVDGVLTLGGHGPEFDVHDANGDGRVDAWDIAAIGGPSPCPADWNRNGQLSLQDLFDFLGSWFAGSGDFNQDGANAVQDLLDFLSAYFAGCP